MTPYQDMCSNDVKVAVLGLGLMGTAILRRLNEQGFSVIGFNRSPKKAEEVAGEGLATVTRASDAVGRAEFLILTLSDAAAIEEVLFADVPLDLDGRILIQMGTIAPTESRALAAKVSAYGGQYLEAPVLGSLPEAHSGRLIIMAGGDAELYERCLPVLLALGENSWLIGSVGRGAALKLAMNQLIAGLTATFSLSLGLVRAEGIEVEQFMALLRNSALYAPTFDKKLANYLSHDYGKANFPLKHLLKDVRLFKHVAEKAGLDTAGAASIEAACLRAIDKGYADQDYSAVYEALTGV